MNREAVKKDANNVELFLESKGYITRGSDCSVSSKELGDVYHTWCEENAYPALKSKTLIKTSGYSSGGWQLVDPDDNPFKT